MTRRWFELQGLRIRKATATQAVYYLTLVDALEARRELDETIVELAHKLDVRQPPSRSGSDD